MRITSIRKAELSTQVDSIPCILGITHDLFLVFSSNMFAVLGLRSLYLLLAEAKPSKSFTFLGFSV